MYLTSVTRDEQFLVLATVETSRTAATAGPAGPRRGTVALELEVPHEGMPVQVEWTLHITVVSVVNLNGPGATGRHTGGDGQLD
jgi:hypothetical protein